MNDESASLIEELKGKIIDTLNLEDIDPSEIEASAPLFEQGLGLDSIDALELVVLLEKEYGISIRDAEVAKKAFASLDSLASFVAENRV